MKKDYDTLKKGYLFIPNFFNEYEVENLKNQ